MADLDLEGQMMIVHDMATRLRLRVLPEGTAIGPFDYHDDEIISFQDGALPALPANPSRDELKVSGFWDYPAKAREADRLQLMQAGFSEKWLDVPNEDAHAAFTHARQYLSLAIYHYRLGKDWLARSVADSRESHNEDEGVSVIEYQRQNQLRVLRVFAKQLSLEKAGLTGSAKLVANFSQEHRMKAKMGEMTETMRRLAAGEDESVIGNKEDADGDYLIADDASTDSEDREVPEIEQDPVADALTDFHTRLVTHEVSEASLQRSDSDGITAFVTSASPSEVSAPEPPAQKASKKPSKRQAKMAKSRGVQQVASSVPDQPVREFVISVPREKTRETGQPVIAVPNELNKQPAGPVAGAGSRERRKKQRRDARRAARKAAKKEARKQRAKEAAEVAKGQN